MGPSRPPSAWRPGTGQGWGVPWMQAGRHRARQRPRKEGELFLPWVFLQEGKHSPKKSSCKLPLAAHAELGFCTLPSINKKNGITFTGLYGLSKSGLLSKEEREDLFGIWSKMSWYRLQLSPTDGQPARGGQQRNDPVDLPFSCCPKMSRSCFLV